MQFEKKTRIGSSKGIFGILIKIILISSITSECVIALLPTVANKESLIAALLSIRKKNIIKVIESFFLILLMDLLMLEFLLQQMERM